MGNGGTSSVEMDTLMPRDDDKRRFLDQVPLFQRLPRDQRPELADCAERVYYKKGDVIIKQGARGDDFFVIRTGAASVEVDGQEVATIGSSDHFGEVALLSDEPRTATITALSAVECFRITRHIFQKLGLHEKLEFKDRNNTLTRRHRMMVVGAAGVQSPSPHSLGVPGEDTSRKREKSQYLGNDVSSVRRSSIDQRMPREEKSYVRSQCKALAEIFMDPLKMSAFVLVPVGLMCNFLKCPSGIIFLFNFLAIIPLASILGQATEALSCHTGQLLGGLLNATFGNAVEMIMCIQAVKAGYVDVVQSNLLGSILSNLLLVLGMAIFTSGIVRKTQEFNAAGAAANMTSLLVASISICLPTCFAATMSQESSADEVLLISRITSIFLMIVYFMFLFFMLKTHSDLFADEEGDEADPDQLGVVPSAVLLAACTVVVFLCSKCLVDTIEGVSENYGLSKAFIGVILLPIVGNAAEHATAVTCAYKGMMDLSLGVAVGSSTQISLFVVPCAVIFGWVNGQPMNLDFTAFDATCQILTVFLVSQVLQHGQTNWLHGAMLMTVYCVVAVQTLFIHVTE